MPQATYHFPAGFLWGAATAAQQVEGNNTNNNWYTWENTPGKIIHGQKAGLACDWWGGRWKEDFDRAAETGQNAHRLSVEWSRIQPARDRWDENALDYYRQMVRGLVERNMTPMVTLHHFSDPIWLMEMGGWANEHTPQLFNSFVRKVVDALKEYVSLWVTINEPNAFLLGAYISGVFPPGEKNLGKAFEVEANLLRGHAAAYRTIHQAQPQARVGIALHVRPMLPARKWFPPDVWITQFQNQIFNESFVGACVNGKLNLGFKTVRIPEAAKTQDFFGLNYYSYDLVKFKLSPAEVFSEHFMPPGTEVSDFNLVGNLPQGMFDALRWANRLGIPILITENGVADDDDDLRPRYLVEHLHQVWRGINFNWPIKGYFHWSLVDNFEWERGWSQRFGLWGLDVETQARIRRPSVDLYAEICQTNAISSDLVARYTPTLSSKLFPG